MNQENTAITYEFLSGLVERVTFHNPDNGYCVLRVKARGHRELVTIVGHSSSISAGEFLQASGAWVNNKTHGPQFKAQFLKVAPPTTEEEIEKVVIEDELTGELCEKCGKPMARKQGRFGDFIACTGYPECKNTKQIVNTVDAQCPKCGKDIIVRRGKSGRR